MLQSSPSPTHNGDEAGRGRGNDNETMGGTTPLPSDGADDEKCVCRMEKDPPLHHVVPTVAVRLHHNASDQTDVAYQTIHEIEENGCRPPNCDVGILLINAFNTAKGSHCALQQPNRQPTGAALKDHGVSQVWQN